MGFSVSAAFSIIVVSALLMISLLYTSFENTYIEISKAKEEHENAKINLLNQRLDANCTYQEGTSDYSMYFNITNNGITLRPQYWNILYDGSINSNYVSLESREYLLPGETIGLNVTNIPKINEIHSLVVTTEYGCSLKIKWEWVWIDQDQTIGEVRVLSESWYCTLEG